MSFKELSFSVPAYQINDAQKDHLFVLNNVIARRENAFTPYLFTCFDYSGSRFYSVQADKLDFKVGYRVQLNQLPSFLMHDSSNNCFNFFIRLNPAIKKKLAEPNRGLFDKLVAITETSEMKTWAKSKLMDVGLATENIKLLSKGPIFCSRGNTTINDAFFHIKAYVFNKERAEELIHKGIGKRKGYGFGMIIPEGSLSYLTLSELYKEELL